MRECSVDGTECACVLELLRGPKNKQRPYAPFWSCALSPRHRWAELAGALLPESETHGHRAWPRACVDTYQGEERETERGQREGNTNKV